MREPIVRPGAAAKAARVRLLLLDVDGVLTDGGIVYDAAGTEIKRFHVRDGHGIKMLQRAGIEVGIVTGRTSAVVDVRAKELGISLLVQGAADKTQSFKAILERTGLSAEQAAYVGDDIVDLPLLRAVGFSASVADAEEYVKDAVDYVASRAGGHGAVREIVEFILRSAGEWQGVSARYFPEDRR